MTPDDKLDAFENPAAELEARIAEASGRGDAVPPEAYAMLARLRELMDAIKGLNATVGGGDGGAPGEDAPLLGALHRASTDSPSTDRPPADDAPATDDVDADRADR